MQHAKNGDSRCRGCFASGITTSLLTSCLHYTGVQSQAFTSVVGVIVSGVRVVASSIGIIASFVRPGVGAIIRVERAFGRSASEEAGRHCQGENQLFGNHDVDDCRRICCRVYRNSVF